MIKIKFIKDTELKKIGDIVNCSKKNAESTVSQGYAEYVEELKFNSKVKKTTKKKVTKKQEEKKILLSDQEVLDKIKEISKLEMPLKINKELRNLKEKCDYTLQVLGKQLNEILKKRKEKDSVTSDISDISDISVTPDIPFESKLPVSLISCITPVLNSIFGNSHLEQIMKILVQEKRVLTDGELALKTGKTETHIRNTISKNKQFFGTIGSKGQKCYRYLIQVAFDEIQLKIDQIELQQEEEKEKEEARKKKEDIEKNYENEVKTLIRNYIPKREGKFIYLDFEDIVKYDPVLADSFLEDPKRFLDIFSKHYDNQLSVQLINLPSSIVINIEELRKEHLDKIICIEGRVTSFGSVRPVIIQTNYECPSCGAGITKKQNYRINIIKEPTRCSCGRRSGLKLIEKVKVNSCFLQLEDLQDKTDNPHSQRIKSVLFKDLCDPNNIKIFTPGNEVKCVGVLRDVPIKNTVHEDFIFEIMSSELIEKEVDLLNLEKKEVEEINELSLNIKQEGIEYILESFAPEIHGYDEIKSSMVLQLCNRRNDKKKKAVRNKSNILLIGDPGIAKSVLGDFALKVSTGSRKAVGGGSSAVGITASVVKEEDSLGGYRVEPGAMILAKDLLFIDELNNLAEDDKPKLQEGMSEQTISINKANLHIQMKVTAGIIAAANPIHGHFKDDSKLSIQEQFNIPTPILNRFDSIFVMRDEVNEEKDKLIAEKMIKRHRGKLDAKYSIEFLRRFFAYIRSLEEPLINDEIQQVFQDVYFKARKTYNRGVKINPRFLESLTRMSISSAKLRQADEVEIKDINTSLKILSQTQYNISENLIIEIDKK